MSGLPSSTREISRRDFSKFAFRGCICDIDVAIIRSIKTIFQRPIGETHYSRDLLLLYNL